jgi:hypothetical protein
MILTINSYYIPKQYKPLDIRALCEVDSEFYFAELRTLQNTPACLFCGFLRMLVWNCLLSTCLLSLFVCLFISMPLLAYMNVSTIFYSFRFILVFASMLGSLVSSLLYLPALPACLFLCSYLEHRESVKHFVSLQFLNLRQSVRRFGQGSARLKAATYTKSNTNPE